MTLLYVTENLVSSATLIDNTYVSTEDAVYTVDKLYNKRPSYPFRFTDKDDEWIKVDFGSAQLITFIGLFNHNLTAAVTMSLEHAAADAGYALATTPVWRSEDLYKQFRRNNRWFRLNIDDPTNDSNPQIGEFVLGVVSEFENARVQPGRRDGPKFHMADNVTHYGQDWSSHYADCESFTITLKNINDKNAVDDLQTFLKSIFRNSDGKFILIPDHDQPHCYYVQVKNRKDFAVREVYGTKELRDWKLELETLTKGITLL